MLKYLASRKKGFTLMELLIAVAIVAVLAGVAIPTYMSFRNQAKASEATGNLGGIKTCESSYHMLNDEYISCTQNPSSAPGVDAQAWDSSTSFDDIGFEPDSNVRFVYAVYANSETGDSASYTAGALGDTDGDGNYIFYQASKTLSPEATTSANDDLEGQFTDPDGSSGLTLSATD